MRTCFINAIRTQMFPPAEDSAVREYLQRTLESQERHLASLEQVQGRLQA